MLEIQNLIGGPVPPTKGWEQKAGEKVDGVESNSDHHITCRDSVLTLNTQVYIQARTLIFPTELAIGYKKGEITKRVKMLSSHTCWDFSRRCLWHALLCR